MTREIRVYLAAGALLVASLVCDAALAQKPLDAATSHFNLARALHQAKRTEQAKDQLLQSLEAAPGFKPAQKMLLDISREER